MTAKSSIDLSGWEAGLAKLQGPLRVSLARSMGVAGGKVLRDEAKRWAPNGEKSGSKTPGLLEQSIYLAFKDGKSTSTKLTYGVSWNGKTAPHGHLVEFGHWMTHQVIQKADGTWITLKDQPLPSPKWVEAKPFLRPAYHVAKGQAKDAMIERGRQRLPELLAGAADEP